MWEYIFFDDFCYIEALLYNEECHSERSPSFTTTPELDCT